MNGAVRSVCAKPGRPAASRAATKKLPQNASAARRTAGSVRIRRGTVPKSVEPQSEKRKPLARYTAPCPQRLRQRGGHLLAERRTEPPAALHIIGKRPRLLGARRDPNRQPRQQVFDLLLVDADHAHAPGAIFHHHHRPRREVAQALK